MVSDELIRALMIARGGNAMAPTRENAMPPESTLSQVLLDKYLPSHMQQWGGLRSYLPDKPNWMRTLLQYRDRALDAMPPEAAFAANFLSPSARVPMPKYTKAWHGSSSPPVEPIEIRPPDEYNSGMFWVALDPAYSNTLRYTGKQGGVHPVSVNEGRQLDFTPAFGAQQAVTAEDMNAFLRKNGVSVDRQHVQEWPEVLYDRIGNIEGAEVQEYLKRPELINELKRAGYDSVKINEWTSGSKAGEQQTIGMLNPENVRLGHHD